MFPSRRVFLVNTCWFNGQSSTRARIRVSLAGYREQRIVYGFPVPVFIMEIDKEVGGCKGLLLYQVFFFLMNFSYCVIVLSIVSFLQFHVYLIYLIYCIFKMDVRDNVDNINQEFF